MKKWGEKSLIIIIASMAMLFVGAIFYRAISVIVIFYEIGKEDLIRGEVLNVISILVAISAAVGGWLVTYKYRQDEKVARYTDWIIAAFVFFALLWTGFQLDWVGKIASVTDVLSFGAIAAAAGTAVYGWRRADLNAQEAREQAERHAQEERERIARADAVILYRKLRGAVNVSEALLINFTGPEFGNLLERFPHSIGVADGELFKLYSWLKFCANHALEGTPNTRTYMEDLRSLYIFETTYADHFMDALSSISEFQEALEFYTQFTIEEQIASYEVSKKMAANEFHYLIKCAANVCVELEICRRELEGVEFETSITIVDFNGYGDCLYSVIKKTNPFNDRYIQPKDYLDLFGLTKSFYEVLSNQSAFSLHGG